MSEKPREENTNEPTKAKEQESVKAQEQPKEKEQPKEQENAKEQEKAKEAEPTKDNALVKAQEQQKEQEPKKYKRNRLPKPEAKRRAREKRIRRAFRIARFRGIKNFLFWFFGVLSSVGIVLGGIFIGVGVVPLSTLVGKDTVSEYLSSDVYDKSILNIALSLQDYTFEDFPIIEKTLGELLGDGNQISAFVDYQKVKSLPTLNESFQVTENVEQVKEYVYLVSSVGVAPLSYSPYAETQPQYEKAFEEDGSLKSSLRDAYTAGTLELFLPPLFEMTLVKGLSSIGTYMDYVEVTDVLKIVGVGEGTLVYDIMEGVCIGDFAKPTNEGGFSAETLLENATLEKLGGTDMLGALGNFSFFQGYEKVPLADYPEIIVDGGNEYVTKEGEEFTSIPSQYYIELVAPVSADGDTPAVEGEYSRAFDDEGKFITEHVNSNGETVTYSSLEDVKTADKLFYADLSKIPFSTALELIGESIFRQDITTLLESFGMDVSEDSVIKKLFDSDDTIESFGKSPEDGGFDFNAIELYSLLGEYDENKSLFDTLLAITGDKPNRNDEKYSSVADEDGDGTPDGEQLYQSDLKSAAEALTVSSLTEDFDLNSVKINDIIEGLEEKTLNLLCSSVNVTKKQEFEANPENVGLEYVPVTKDTLTIGDFQSFKVDNIMLKDVIDLPTEENEYQNQQIYDILLDATGATSYEEISINSLSGDGFSVDNIKLSTVLGEYEGNKTLYEIILSANGLMVDRNDVKYSSVADEDGDGTPDGEQLYQSDLKSAAEAITIENLDGLDTNKVALTIVLPYKPAVGDDAGTETLYKILKDVTGQTDENKITIGDLSSFDTNKIKLGSVLPYKSAEGDDAGTETLYKILKDVTGKDSDAVTVGDLSNFDTSKIKLATVIEPSTDNQTLYDILMDVTGKASDVVTVGDLSSFNTTDIKLSTVLKQTDDNQTLYDILKDVTGKDSDTVTVGDLSSFNTNDIKLSTVLPYSEGDPADEDDVGTKMLYDILMDVTGESNRDNITVGSLSNFNTKNIKLSTVLGEGSTGNSILDALVEKEVTVGNISSAINALSLFELYGDTCFTTTMPEDYTGDKFTRTESGGVVTYTRDNVNGNYYINQTSGIWLLLSFKPEMELEGGKPTTGIPNKYVSSDITMQTLQNDGQLLGKTFLNATIYQLKEAGLITIETLNPEVAKLSINDVINKMNNPLG